MVFLNLNKNSIKVSILEKELGNIEYVDLPYLHYSYKNEIC